MITGPIIRCTVYLESVWRNIFIQTENRLWTNIERYNKTEILFCTLLAFKIHLKILVLRVLFCLPDESSHENIWFEILTFFLFLLHITFYTVINYKCYTSRDRFMFGWQPYRKLFDGFSRLKFYTLLCWDFKTDHRTNNL